MPNIDPRLKKIGNWLKENPAISAAAICKKVGIQKSNFSAALSGSRSIPDKYISLFEKELNKYGYKK